MFPSPETWEFSGLTSSEQCIALENVLKITDALSNTETHCMGIKKPEDQEIGSKKLKKKKEKAKNASGKKFILFPPCQNACRKKCFQQISLNDRKQIFDYFQGLNFGERQLFFNKYLVKKDIKYRKVDAENNRKFSVSYYLPTTLAFLTKPNECEDLKPVESNTDLSNEAKNSVEQLVVRKQPNLLSVCKIMFIHTIGFKTDGVLTNFFNRTRNDISSLPRVEDRRGNARSEQMKKLSEVNCKNIEDHVESYHPQVSHYNIKHAPHRRYLPSDLSIHAMHKDFNLKFNPISYETYRKGFEKQNIGFTTPTQDDCNVCSIYKQHCHDKTSDDVPGLPSNLQTENGDNTTAPNINNSDVEIQCSICSNYDVHKQRYTIARQQYLEDTTKKWDDDWELYAADMQKVLILPKMTLKNSFFVSRLVVFHETFANLKPAGQNKCVLWHEAIKGRNAPDVVSAYYNVLIKLNTETKHVVFWADNCTAQNKNWTLFTACIIFVNEKWGPETITFKYFEPGHSFMKADAIHGQIGKKWNKTPEVLDYEDLENLITAANKRNNIISLHAEDFKPFENGCMQRKKGSSLPKVNELKSVQLRKGSKKLFYKLELEEDKFIEAAILNPKFKLSLPESSEFSPRGLNAKKKETIVKQLLPHMPPRKQIFWTNLSSSENLEDLGKTVAQI